MFYLLFYDTTDDYLERRTEFRGVHLDHARAAVARGELVLGGAMNEPVDGAVLVFRGDSPAVAFSKLTIPTVVRSPRLGRRKVLAAVLTPAEEAGSTARRIFGGAGSLHPARKTATGSAERRAYGRLDIQRRILVQEPAPGRTATTGSESGTR